MGAFPGLSAAKTSAEAAFLLSRIETSLWMSTVMDGAARDTGNSPQTTMRPGILVGQVGASKKFKQYDPTATDGTQEAVGALAHSVQVIDPEGNNEDQSAIIVLSGLVRASSLLLLDIRARTILAGRMVFDDQLITPLLGYEPMDVKSANYTVVAADNRKRYSTRGAIGAVQFTLPALSAVGRDFRVRFYNEVNQNMTIIRAGTDVIVAFNNAAATSLAFSTLNEKIGADLEVRVNDNATAFLASAYSKHTLTVT